MSLKIQQGTGYTFTQSGQGFLLNIDNQGGRSPSAPLVVTLTSDGTQTFAKVTPGTVNQSIPKINGTYIDAAEAPKLTVSSAGYIIVTVTRVANSPFPKEAVISFVSTIPADTSNNGSCVLASITKSGDKYGVITYVAGNLNCHRLRVGGAANAFYYWSVL